MQETVPRRLSSDRSRFRQIYLRSAEDVLSFWTESMQKEISKHNFGWYSTDFREYLRQSEVRYWVALSSIEKTGQLRSLCDVGGFFGAFPLALRRMGVEVAMTEALGYYSDSFSPLFSYLRGQGVEIIDHDPFEANWHLSKQFDVVSAMAVLEHYPHSPRRFLDHLSSMIGPMGRLYIEVPNIAYWPKRLALLRGRSPLASIEDVYLSAVPFIGHHRELTIDEVRRLAKLANLTVLHSEHYNYSFVGPWIKRFISDPVLTLMSHRPAMRECLSVVLGLTARHSLQNESHG